MHWKALLSIAKDWIFWFLIEIVLGERGKWVFVCGDKSSFLETKYEDLTASEIFFLIFIVVNAN